MKPKSVNATTVGLELKIICKFSLLHDKINPAFMDLKRTILKLQTKHLLFEMRLNIFKKNILLSTHHEQHNFLQTSICSVFISAVKLIT